MISVMTCHPHHHQLIQVNYKHETTPYDAQTSECLGLIIRSDRLTLLPMSSAEFVTATQLFPLQPTHYPFGRRTDKTGGLLAETV